RPSMSYQFDLTLQRQITNKVTVEFGYIGRKISHEFQLINFNAIPYMMTLGGQSFAKAYGQMVWQFCGGNAGLAGGNCAGIDANGNVVSAQLAAVATPPFFQASLRPPYYSGIYNHVHAGCA